MHNLIIIFIFAALLTGCSNNIFYSQSAYPANLVQTEKQPPQWLKTASIYQINTRQFTKEGTLKSAEKQLPRLKSLGVDVLWLMPIHPIGEKNRKGTLGSPYAVKDYFAVNPEFGTIQDIKQFVASAHKLGMYVILDWVANHTAWDNVIRQTQPQWYTTDFKGDNISTLWFDWYDIIDLDYSNNELQEYMLKAMAYWVKEIGVDGYRCDAAGLVPNAFWQRASQKLNKIKPVFMLAEWEGPQFYDHGFDATYAWGWWDTMHKIAQGHAKADSLHSYYAWNHGYYPDRAMRLMYVSNHDVNSWESTQFESFGDALYSAITLSIISEGIPMIYNGQEAGNVKRLEFYERDTIEWQAHPVGDLYRRLFALKKVNSALWNGKWGARMMPIHNDNKNILSFVRENTQDKIVAVFNLSPVIQTVRLLDAPLFTGKYVEFNTGETTKLQPNAVLTLAPWETVLLIQP